jgi:hypothetical protein
MDEPEGARKLVDRALEPRWIRLSGDIELQPALPQGLQYHRAGESLNPLEVTASPTSVVFMAASK